LIPSKKSISLISEANYQAIYGTPLFSIEDRRILFLVNEQEKALVDSFKTTKEKIFFILQLGIFRKKALFFPIKHGDFQFEIEHIRRIYFYNSKRSFSLPSVYSLKNHKKIILEIMGYRKSCYRDRVNVEKLCLELVKISVDREFLFKRVKEHFDNNKILLPSYNFFCKMISISLVKEKKRLNIIMKKHFKNIFHMEINSFLESNLGILRSEPKDFSLREIKEEIEKANLLNRFLPGIELVISDLRISNEGLKYYASLFDYYHGHRLKRLSKGNVALYLCCYIYVKIQEVNDNLINSFIHHINSYLSLAKEFAKEEIYQNKEDNKLALKGLPDILNIVLDESNGERKLSDIQKYIYKIVPRNEILELVKLFSNKKLDIYQYEWDYFEKSYLKFIKYLRPVLKNVKFESSVKNSAIFEAILFLKNSLLKTRKIEKGQIVPDRFIPSHLRKYIYDNRAIIPSRYEFLVYKMLKNGIESGEIYVDKSIHYKCFERDLISEEDWNRRKFIINSSDLAILKRPIKKTIEILENELHKKILDVNERIKNEENPYIKVIHKNEKIQWSLKYEANKDIRDIRLFSDRVQIGISDLLRYVDSKCPFTNIFTHFLRTESSSGSKESILACIISFGTNLGLYRMSQISNLTYKELSDTAQNFIREETLKKANDLIADEISKLPTFDYFNLENEPLHSSSDGQKFEVQFDSFNTRYSSKYFGLGKGVSCYTLMANHIPINAKIIGANEYEGHHVFDLIYNNSTQIKPKVHSTDTHGVNQVNFAILDFFEYQFAPRYKKFANRKIFSFLPLSYYSKLIIRPYKTINKDLIINEWENIQKIILSLQRKSCTQAIIIQKLSSYKRQNKTKQALWEYNKIIESLYILNYIDDIYLRKNVQKALNLVESYHQLKRCVAFANYGKIKAQTEREQIIWSECCRLISNCIIYYNSLILTQALSDQSSEILSKLKNKSPMAWKHINFFGNYEFKKKIPKVNFGELVKDIFSVPDEMYQ
jgi:TnpA family transposase